MSGNSLPPLHLTLDASPALCRWLQSLHAIGLLALTVTELPLWMRSLLLLAVCASFLVLNHQQKRQVGSILLLEPDGTVTLDYLDGTRLHGPLLPEHSVSTPALVILQFGTGWKSRSILISRDATDSERFRQLRVTLTCLPRRRHFPGL